MANQAYYRWDQHNCERAIPGVVLNFDAQRIAHKTMPVATEDSFYIDTTEAVWQNAIFAQNADDINWTGQYLVIKPNIAIHIPARVASTADISAFFADLIVHLQNKDVVKISAEVKPDGYSYYPMPINVSSPDSRQLGTKIFRPMVKYMQYDPTAYVANSTVRVVPDTLPSPSKWIAWFSSNYNYNYSSKFQLKWEFTQYQRTLKGLFTIPCGTRDNLAEARQKKGAPFYVYADNEDTNDGGSLWIFTGRADVEEYPNIYQGYEKLGNLKIPQFKADKTYMLGDLVSGTLWGWHRNSGEAMHTSGIFRWDKIHVWGVTEITTVLDNNAQILLDTKDDGYFRIENTGGTGYSSYNGIWRCVETRTTHIANGDTTDFDSAVMDGAIVLITEPEDPSNPVLQFAVSANHIAKFQSAPTVYYNGNRVVPNYSDPSTIPAGEKYRYYYTCIVPRYSQASVGDIDKDKVQYGWEIIADLSDGMQRPNRDVAYLFRDIYANFPSIVGGSRETELGNTNTIYVDMQTEHLFLWVWDTFDANGEGTSGHYEHVGEDYDYIRDIVFSSSPPPTQGSTLPESEDRKLTFTMREISYDEDQDPNDQITTSIFDVASNDDRLRLVPSIITDPSINGQHTQLLLDFNADYIDTIAVPDVTAPYPATVPAVETGDANYSGGIAHILIRQRVDNHKNMENHNAYLESKTRDLELRSVNPNPMTEPLQLTFDFIRPTITEIYAKPPFVGDTPPSPLFTEKVNFAFNTRTQNTDVETPFSIVNTNNLNITYDPTVKELYIGMPYKDYIRSLWAENNDTSVHKAKVYINMTSVNEKTSIDHLMTLQSQYMRILAPRMHPSVEATQEITLKPKQRYYSRKWSLANGIPTYQLPPDLDTGLGFPFELTNGQTFENFNGKIQMLNLMATAPTTRFIFPVGFTTQDFDQFMSYIGLNYDRSTFDSVNPGNDTANPVYDPRNQVLDLNKWVYSHVGTPSIDFHRYSQAVPAERRLPQIWIAYTSDSRYELFVIQRDSTVPIDWSTLMSEQNVVDYLVDYVYNDAGGIASFPLYPQQPLFAYAGVKETTEKFSKIDTWASIVDIDITEDVPDTGTYTFYDDQILAYKGNFWKVSTITTLTYTDLTDLTTQIKADTSTFVPQEYGEDPRLIRTDFFGQEFFIDPALADSMDTVESCRNLNNIYTWRD